jgi:hypothetical protein
VETTKRHKIHEERLVVVSNTGTNRLVKRILIPLSFVILPAIASLTTYIYFGTEERALEQHINEQETELNDLLQKLDHTEQMRVNAQVDSEVDRQAIEGLRKELVTWANRYGQQEEKIQFYQSLMDPNTTNSGVYIESVEIEPTAEERLFNYRILLAQRSSDHSRVNGLVNVELISGENSDGIQTIPLKELTGEPNDLTLGFKFFQQFDGRFKLPEGFEPGQIKLVVTVNGNASARLEEVISWPVRS